MSEPPSRNGKIEVLRFAFSLVIIGFHTVTYSTIFSGFPFFQNGAIGVEFFFLLTGHLLMKSIAKSSSQPLNGLGRETGAFVWKKAKGVLPCHLIANVLMIVVIIAVRDYSNLITRLTDGIPGLFLVQMANVWSQNTNEFIEAEWYLSSMLLMLLIIYPVGRWLSKKWSGARIPAVIMSSGLGLLLIFGCATKWQHMPYNLIQDVRAFGEICLGMFTYIFSEKLMRKHISDQNRKRLSLLEIIGYLYALIYVHIPLGSGLLYYGCYALAMVSLSLSVTISFSQTGWEWFGNLFQKPICAYLGAISLPIYLFHPVVIKVSQFAFKGYSELFQFVFVYVASIALASMFCHFARKPPSAIGKKLAI